MTELGDGKILWLWLNGDHYLAYDNPYPTEDGGDPLTLGEPIANAIFRRSVPANNRRLVSVTLSSPNDADRCYEAGWSDMKAAACHLLRWEGYEKLADMVDAIEKPPSGDK